LKKQSHNRVHFGPQHFLGITEYWSRDREGGDERAKAALEGAKTVREGNPSVDCGVRPVWEASSRVRAMEE
jgi:hypothetical protein